jgi:hypothetical protein
MSLVKKLLLGVGGAALMVTGVASTASAQDLIGAGDHCDLYAREYAAVHAPSFAGWDMAYRHAFNECITGGPTFVSARPFAGPFGLAGAALAAPLGVAGAAVHAGATVAGAVLEAPATIAAGTAAALAPPPLEPAVEATVEPEPVVTRNFVGSLEAEPVVAVEAPPAIATLTTASALGIPAAAPQPFTSEWHAYCAAKYRSFDPTTGMYLAYSGAHRMCR